MTTDTSNGRDSSKVMRNYRLHMGPAYVSKYKDSSPTVTSLPPEKVEEIMKRTTPVANEDYERGELGSSSTSSSGSDEDSNDSGDEKKESNAKEIKPEIPARGNFKKLTPTNPETIKSNLSSISDLVSPVKSLSVSQDEIKKLENEIKRLKEQLTENETQRLNQKKQYQSKISNLMAYNDQLLIITKQLSSVVENTTTKLTSDHSKEKELLLQIQQVKMELSKQQMETVKFQEINVTLKKSMEMYQQKFVVNDINTYQQTNQLLWGQIILWIFVVVIFVIVFSLFIKQTSKMEV